MRSLLSEILAPELIHIRIRHRDMLRSRSTPIIQGAHMSNGVAASRILIADSDAAVRATYIASLADHNRDVIEATDGRDALVKALVRVPSLVITELDLPHVDGFTLCEILRRDRVTADVPILVVTNRHDPSDVGRAHRVGADVVLAKSLQPDTLAREVARLLEQGRALRVRAMAVRAKATQLQHRSTQLMAASVARQSARGRFQRITTTNPPLNPPSICCLTCERPLIYEHSYIGGVDERHIEQWDCFICSGGCGRFRYRQRTRQLRQIS
jgi:PleD family two-component response regulator